MSATPPTGSGPLPADNGRLGDAFAPGPGAERAFRDALGAYATGVTVITTDTPGGPVGITANSFASLSLDPPLVLWSPARASRRFAIFAAAERFAVHILAAEQEGLARHFTRTGEPPGADSGVGGLDRALARFECLRHAVHPGGDHAIVVGLVERAVWRPGAPLVFHGGRFGALGGPG